MIVDKKSILIIGPITDFGGREVMTNLLVIALLCKYELRVFSTTSMSRESVALANCKDNWDTLSYNLYRRNIILRISAWVTKLKNRKVDPAHYFIGNKLSRKFFDFEKLHIETIKKEITKADMVIYSGEINGKWLEEIRDFSTIAKIPFLFIITGEIKRIPLFISNQDEYLSVLAHSAQNALILEKIENVNVYHIDQTTVLENALLNVNITADVSPSYGYLGRFNEEKGILELLKAFRNRNAKLFIAGNGPLLSIVLESCKSQKNISYVGELSPSEISGFFEKFEVLVIPSFEEGGPIVGVEGMAAGKLILSTRVGAMPERLEHTGSEFWFDNKSEGSILVSLEKIEALSSKERIMIRERVRKKYVKYNSLGVINKKYLSVITNLFKISN